MLKCSIYDLFSNGSQEKDWSKFCKEEMMLSSTYYPCPVSTQLEEFAVSGIVGEVVRAFQLLEYQMVWQKARKGQI